MIRSIAQNIRGISCRARKAIDSIAGGLKTLKAAPGWLRAGLLSALGELRDLADKQITLDGEINRAKVEGAVLAERTKWEGRAALDKAEAALLEALTELMSRVSEKVAQGDQGDIDGLLKTLQVASIAVREVRSGTNMTANSAT